MILKSTSASQPIPQPKTQNICFDVELRRAVMRGSHQGKAYDAALHEWPNVGRYAQWYGCSHTALLNYGSGKTETLGPPLIDPLAYLTGIYPLADPEERAARIVDTPAAGSCGRRSTHPRRSRTST